MKKLILFLTITILISCKKEANKSVQNEIQNTQTNEISFVSYGVRLIDITIGFCI